MVAEPYAAGGTWYKGNLHVASVRGVGKDLPSAIGAWYAAHGYAFLGISDMNTYTWASEYGNRAHPAVPTVDATYAFAEVLAVAFFASTGAAFTGLRVDGKTITVEATPGSSLRFIGRGGHLLQAVSTSTASYQVRGDESYVRVEAIRDDGARAWSQPFFVSRR